MKRLLAVSWEMPPLSGPRAVHVSMLLRHLVPLGWASTVICFGPRSDRYNQDYALDPARESGGAIELVRVPSPEERPWFRALWRVCPPVKMLPDEKWVWIAPAVAAARRSLAAQPTAALVSFGQPWSDHLIGLRLHRESGLPWIAHFSDPWVDNPYARGYGWQRRIWRRMEGDVIEHATRLIFHTAQTAERTMRRYPQQWAQKVSVIPQGIEPDRLPPAPRRRDPGPLRIVYTGRFYPGIRTPDTVLRALAQLQKDGVLQGRATLDVYGFPFAPYAEQARELGLSALVTFHGRVPPADTVAAAQRADVLLVIDAASDGPSLFLPSKLIEYLPLRKPILGVVPTAGASADLLRRLDYPAVDPRDVGAIAHLFAQAIDAWERGTLTPSATHDVTARSYEIAPLARAFAELLNQIGGTAAAAS